MLEKTRDESTQNNWVWEPAIFNLIYYNLWHTITEANGCNAKESRTPYYSRTPKVQKKKQTKKSFKYNTNP